MGKKFDIDRAIKLCDSLKKTVDTISSESLTIRQFFIILNYSFFDSEYYELQNELREADSIIDNICVEINDLIRSLKDYTTAMSELLSSTEKLFCYDTKTVKIAKNLDIVKNIKNWLPNINPNCDRFDISSPYLNNCGSCAFAIYHRFEGLNPNACALAVNIGYYFQMEQPTGLKQVKTTPNEIESYLLVAGNGARVIVGVDRSFGLGHRFNAVCINNKVYAIDGQSGEMIE